MKTRILTILSIAPAALAGGDCAPVGSETIDRLNLDSFGGLILIYRGATSPVAGPGTADQWEFYSDSAQNQWVTPLLFRVDGTTFTLVGVGESRLNTAAGVQAHAFGFTTGSSELESDQEYTFGFTTRRLAAGPSPDAVTTVNSYGGIIPFIGYNISTDPWDYATPGELTIGQEFGPGLGQTPLNNLGMGGRIYSANFSIDCACPADLAPPAGTLNFFDVSAFLGAYNTQNHLADFAAPFGTFNFFDVSAFLAAYNTGCP